MEIYFWRRYSFRVWLNDLVSWNQGFSEQDFSVGILPLNLAFPSLVEHVDRIAIDSNTPKNPVENHSESLLRMKLEEQGHWGSYAFLVRNTLLNGSSTNHYLQAPEIVEDYIRSQYGNHAEKMMCLYKKETTPAIVYFRNSKLDMESIKEALLYAWLCIQEGEDCFSVGITFSSRGNPISPDLIVHIEKLTDSAL